ncbi:family 20 glycosylhydrolase [Pararhodonellum marinum]|uniref:family 20 glycosylhydrolase n=1 Tax=Pararhodonellum marinum TaxID=2755358 RepID=UPI0018901CC7|nr:family 20 glycosylhydrolase [Pararhodonellum marinum]
MKQLLVSAFLVIVFWACQQNGHMRLDDLSLHWDLPEGIDLQSYSHIGEFTLTNYSNMPLEGDWTIFFNSMFIPPDLEMLSEGAIIVHLQGDYLKISPNEDYQNIQPGESLSIRYKASAPMIKNAHVPEAVYWVWEKDLSNGIPFKNYSTFQITLDALAQAATGSSLPIPTAEFIYQENENNKLLPENEIPPFLPSPKEWAWGEGILELNAPLIISYDESFQKEAAFLGKQLKALFTEDIYFVKESNGNKANITLSKTLGPMGLESYALNVDPDEGILIEANHSKGIFYGIQSLLALFPEEVHQKPKEKVKIPAIQIKDEPFFAYRGLFLDIARNFQDKEAILKLLDLMAFYKLNVFHFNLANDEGWRIEIPGLQELISVGSQRGHAADEDKNLWPYYGSGPNLNLPPGAGFLFRNELIEILRYAHERHIEVIPEIGGPAHFRAAIQSMRHRYNEKMKSGDPTGAMEYLLDDLDDKSEYLSAQNFSGNTLCVCQESTYKFYEKVIDEISSMYREAQVPLSTFHTGGDEVPHGVWSDSPICKDFIESKEGVSEVGDLSTYFIERISAILENRGIQMAGWEEVGQVRETEDNHGDTKVNPDFSNKGFRLYAWNSVPGWGGEDMAYRLANAGYEVIVCNSSNIYFDLAYDMDPDEPGHVWSGLVDMKRSWRTVAYNHFLSNERDMYGNSLDPEALAREKVGLTTEGRQNIKGIQGQLWTETVKGQESMEYYLLPKMLGLVERAWSGDAAWSQIPTADDRETAFRAEWNQFANAVGQRELPRLQWLHGGYHFRLPKPGAIIKNGFLHANVETPGLEIRYTTDGKEPGPQSKLYTEPVAVTGEIRLKAFVPNGRSGNEMVLFPKNQLPLK